MVKFELDNMENKIHEIEFKVTPDATGDMMFDCFDIKGTLLNANI